MKTSEFLKQAKSLIADPNHWLKGNFSTTAQGEDISPGHEDAVCFCSDGALYAIAQRSGDYNSRAVARSYLTIPLGGDSLWTFNDNRQHYQVMGLFDEAIKRAEKDEQNG